MPFGHQVDADKRIGEKSDRAHDHRLITSHDRILMGNRAPRQSSGRKIPNQACGERGRARTCNRQLRRLMLYPIELLARVSLPIVAVSRL